VSDSDRQVLHPTLGRSAKNGATDTCSICGHTIPEEHVPLILWSQDGTLLWAYCEKHEHVALSLIKKPAAVSA
jgi:hypothetical protein